MPSGYVYLLINPSMPGLIKIGRTRRDSRGRARTLCTTGVPTPFEVAFEIFSDVHETLEDQMHVALHAFRVNSNREFFRYPLKDAIELLLRFNVPPSESQSAFSAIGILHRLKERYPTWLDPSIADVQIVQTVDRVWLEITREEEIAGYLKDQTIKRSDLAFISDDDNYGTRFFAPTQLVTENARKLIEEFDPYSISMTTELFHDKACSEVNAIFNSRIADHNAFQRPISKRTLETPSMSGLVEKSMADE